MSTTSLFVPGVNCAETATARHAAILIDGAAYYEAFVRAAEKAERSILILAWDFDSRMVPRVDGDDARVQLGEFLNRLAHERPRLRIKILDWDYPMIYGTDREIPPIYGIAWKPHRHIDFHYDDTHPLGGSHHQKIVVIDDKLAFSGGQDLASKRWDTPEHKACDPRRAVDGKPYPPQHDVMIAVDGEAAVALARIARKRWVDATGQRIAPVRATASDPWPEHLEPDFENVRVGISCTAPTRKKNDGARHVERLYLDMIASARHSIYIENQYFTSEKVGEALEARLKEATGPEIVLVTRLLSHGWLEEMTMHVLRTRLLTRLRKADRHGRFHAYYPHVEGLAEGTCVDVHSKVMAVDDEWLRIGSSNVSNRSMGMDTECDVTIEALGNEGVKRNIRRIRNTLLAEHMGVPIESATKKLAELGSIAAVAKALRAPQRWMKPLEVQDLPDAVVDMAAIGDLEKPISLDALVDNLSPLAAAEKEPGSAKVTLAVAIVLLLLLALMWRYTPLSEVVTPENVVGWAQSMREVWWAPAIVVVAYTPASLVMFPRPLITMASVVAFGPIEGAVYALSGIVVSALVGYVAGRLLNRHTVRRIAGARVTRLSRFLHHKGLLAMTLVRLVPIAPFQVINVVAGAMHIRFRDFVLGTVIGMFPGLLAATVLGDQIVAALADSARLNMWMIAVAALALAGAAFFGQRWFRRVEH